MRRENVGSRQAGPKNLVEMPGDGDGVQTGNLRTRAAEAWRVILLGAAIIVAGLGTLVLIGRLWRPLALLAFGVVVAEALAPIVDWLERRLPRIASVLLVYLVLLLIMAGILYLAVPALVDQVQRAITQAPGAIQRVEHWLAVRHLQLGPGAATTLGQPLAGFGASLLRLPLAVFDSLFDLVVVLFVSLYWLIQAPDMLRFLLSLVPAERHERLRQVLHDMGRAMGGYLRGTAINGLILGIATSVGLSLIGVDYPLLLGLIAGLMEFVPVVGTTISAVLIVLVALTQSLTLALMALALATALHQIENHILVPNIMHSQTNISPLLAVLAVVAGATLGGLLGAFISIPLVSALQVFAGEVVAPAIRRRTGAALVEAE